MSVTPTTTLAPDVQPAAFNALSSSSLALAIWFDDRVFERAKEIARYLSAAEGFAPPHLIGKKEACFAVVERALTWKLSPYAVAQSTYQTPGGKVGFEGKLCQAILENSGRIEGGVRFEYFGDWSKIQGKFRKAKSDKGKEYAVSDWKPEDEAGLGVFVRAQVRGENEKRELKFLLVQAFPRNSTLWATDPMTQLGYLAVRRFANSAAPGIFLGVPFDRDDEDAAMMARDVNPRPARADFAPDKATMIEDAPVAAEIIEPTAEDEALADRMAQQFAETGQHPSDEAKAEADGAEEECSDERADTVRAEPIETEVKTEAERPNAAFWSGDNYSIAIPATPKGSPHWPNWDGYMRSAATDAQTKTELAQLDTDNGKNWQQYQVKQPDAAKALRLFFVARAEELSQ